jgi:hypothetical protein
LGCEIPVLNAQEDINNNLKKFQPVGGRYRLMCETIKGTLGYKTVKHTELGFCKTTAPPCVMYGSATWTPTRTGEERLVILCDEIRAELGMRKLDKHVHERKRTWLEHLKRMPSE